MEAKEDLKLIEFVKFEPTAITAPCAEVCFKNMDCAAFGTYLPTQHNQLVCYFWRGIVFFVSF